MSEDIIKQIKRRYFEAFGDLEQEIGFLRKLGGILSGALVLSVCFLFLLGQRPPVVIRVSEAAAAQALRSLDMNNAPTVHEVIAFAKRFTVRFKAYNSYTISRDLAEALNQMTGRFQLECRKKYIESGLVSEISSAGINTEIEFKEARLEREARDIAVVSLVGVRRTAKYGTGDYRDILFRSDIVLKKVRRSVNVPDGLLVEDYQEMTLNDLTERSKGK